MEENERSVERSVLRKKRTRALILLLAALVLAGAAAYGTWQFLSPKRVTAWLFRDNYKAGTVLTGDMLYAVQVDAAMIAAGADSATASRFVTGSDVRAVVNAGDSLRVDVSEGMPLTRAMLSVTGGTSVELNLDPSKIAITVPATAHSGVTNGLLPGSYVNVYATGYSTAGDEASTVLLFQRARVLATQKSNGSLSGITLEMDAADSLKLVNALKFASLYFGLVDSFGYQDVADGLSYTPSVQAPAADGTKSAAAVPDAYQGTEKGGER